MPPTRLPQRVTVHIGSGKTGTSTIQSFMKTHREDLAAAGVLWPRGIGRVRHIELGGFIQTAEQLERQPWWVHRDPQIPYEQFRRRFRRRVFGQINRSGLQRVLFSDEGLFVSGDDCIDRLRRFLRRFAEQVDVVVYLRRQDDHLVSLYQEKVKSGGVRTLEAFATQPWPRYDYANRLRHWRQRLDPDRMIVRRFEPGGFASGSLTRDFLDAAEITLPDLPDPPSRNESLSAEAVEFLRLYNVLRIREGTERRGLIHNHRLVARLRPLAPGPALTLPDDLLDAFGAQWEESNAEVARAYFGDTTGRLFRAPRKRAGCTVQQIDPDRVEELAAGVELPEEHHRPLRALAEQALVG